MHMPDKKDFADDSPYHGVRRGGAYEISLRTTFYLAILCTLNTIGWVAFYFHWKHVVPWHDDVSQSAELDSMCKFSEPLADYCVLQGDIRIHGNSSTIFIYANDKTILTRGNSSWTRIKPYPRKSDVIGMKSVREWTIKLVGDRESVPRCTQTHDVPAILFSLAARADNFFHSFTDILIPLFTNSFGFNGEVHFLSTNYSPHWVFRFRTVFAQLSRYQVVNIDMEKGVRCYRRAIIGLEREIAFDLDLYKSPNNVTMMSFRQFIRSVYSLERSKVRKLGKGGVANRKVKPRLMIVSRENSRRWRNLSEMRKTARKLGFDVVVVEPKWTNNVAKFGRLVNSCDVLMGIHGAALANSVFLPDEAVLIQVIPFGMKYYGDVTFGDPARSMNLRYLEYEIEVNESSLIERYPIDDPVFTKPLSVHKKGWEHAKAVYLDNQDVTLNTVRFRRTLVKALHLLHY